MEQLEQFLILNTLLNKDKLLPCTEILLEEEDFFAPFFRLTLRRFPQVEVFPIPDIMMVVDYIRRDNSLWNQAELAVDTKKVGQKRASIFGFPLRRL